MDLSSPFLGRPILLQLGNRDAFGVVLLVGMGVFSHLEGEFYAEGIYAGGAVTVQAARDLVIGRIEFAPGMQLGEHYLQGGHALASGNIHFIYRDAAAVVGNGDGIVDMDGYVDMGCVASEGFVDGIIL